MKDKRKLEMKTIADTDIEIEYGIHTPIILSFNGRFTDTHHTMTLHGSEDVAQLVGLIKGVLKDVMEYESRYSKEQGE